MSKLGFALDALGLLSKRAKNAQLIKPGIIDEAIKRLDHAVTDEEMVIVNRAIGRAQRRKVQECSDALQD